MSTGKSSIKAVGNFIKTYGGSFGYLALNFSRLYNYAVLIKYKNCGFRILQLY
jgi:hypothetical protein